MNKLEGAKFSTQNGTQLISTGSAQLDDFIGGGLSLGTITIVQATPTMTYADLVLRYYLSQGLSFDNHEIFFASTEISATTFQRSLLEPQNVRDAMAPVAPGQKSSPLGRSDSMKIAWRYQALPRLDEETPDENIAPMKPGLSSFRKAASGSSAFTLGSSARPLSAASAVVSAVPFCAQFDITKNVSEKTLANVASRWSSFAGSSLSELLDDIRERMPTRDKVLRVAISSMGSPFWKNSSPSEICRFLYDLQELITGKNVVCLVTIPEKLFSDFELARMHHLVDAVVGLETFASSDPSYFAKEYTGLIQLIKAPCLNRLAAPRRFVQGKVTGIDKRYGFRCRKKKLVIEKMCLPPDLSMPTDAAKSKESQSGCGQTW